MLLACTLSKICSFQSPKFNIDIHPQKDKPVTHPTKLPKNPPDALEANLFSDVFFFSKKKTDGQDALERLEEAAEGAEHNRHRISWQKPMLRDDADEKLHSG